MKLASGISTSVTGAWLSNRARKLAQDLLALKQRFSNKTQIIDGFVIRASRANSMAKGVVLDPPGNVLLLEQLIPASTVGARRPHLITTHARDVLNPDLEVPVSVVSPTTAAFGGAGQIFAVVVGDADYDEFTTFSPYTPRAWQNPYGCPRMSIRVETEDPVQFDYYGLPNTRSQLHMSWYDYGTAFDGSSGRIGFKLIEPRVMTLAENYRLHTRVDAYYGYEAPLPFGSIGVDSTCSNGLAAQQLTRQESFTLPIDYGKPGLWLQRFRPTFLDQQILDDGAFGMLRTSVLLKPEQLDAALAPRTWKEPPTEGWPLQGVDYVDEFWENFTAFPAGVLPQWFDDLVIADDGTQFIIRGVLNSVLDAEVPLTGYYLRVARTSFRGTMGYVTGAPVWSIQSQELFADNSTVDFGVPVSDPAAIHMEHVLGMARVGEQVVEVLVRYEAERGTSPDSSPGGTQNLAEADMTSRRWVFIQGGVETTVLGSSINAYPQGNIALISLPATFVVNAVGARFSGQSFLVPVDDRRLAFDGSLNDLGQRYICWYDTVTKVATRGALLPIGPFDDPDLEQNPLLQVIQRAELDEAGLEIKPATLMLSWNRDTRVWLSKDTGTTWELWIDQVNHENGGYYLGNGFHVGKRLGELCRQRGQ